MDSPLAPSPSRIADPAALAARLRNRGIPGVALLQSGLDLDGLGRFSFVAARPRVIARAEAGADLVVVEGGEGLPTPSPGDPLRAAAQLIAAARPPGWAPTAPYPFSGGAVLALSYDLGRRYERLPEHAVADGAPPDLHVAVYGQLLAFDHQRGVCEWIGAGPGLTAEEVEAALAEPPLGELPVVAAAPPPAPCTFDAPGYRAAVQTARDRIREGALFEVNLSRRFTLEGVDPDRAYAAMTHTAPAPFMADLDLGHGWRLLSSSPERFLKLTAEGRASSWPIKGTRPRGQSPDEDQAHAAALLASSKEQAELNMIVDLVRNDLGRVARPGSVEVRSPRQLQTWPTVHHTVAVIEADLDADRDWADLVRAAFPPGSVTGAPKIRAMELIDELEPVRRGLYCGSFGYVGFDGAADLAVAIRIVQCEGERAHVHAGGAVLLKSDPAEEELETLTKASALLRATHAAQAVRHG